MAKMKIVVTGATGILGKATAEHLVKQGHEVISVDRKEAEFAEGSELIVGDLTSLEFCDSVMSGAQGVVHLGAIPNPTDTRQFEVFKNNSGWVFYIFMPFWLIILYSFIRGIKFFIENRIDTGITIYLTFDDGPYTTTPAIDSVLTALDIKASFFILSFNISNRFLLIKKLT